MDVHKHVHTTSTQVRTNMVAHAQARVVMSTYTHDNRKLVADDDNDRDVLQCVASDMAEGWAVEMLLLLLVHTAGAYR